MYNKEAFYRYITVTFVIRLPDLVKTAYLAHFIDKNKQIVVQRNVAHPRRYWPIIASFI